MNRLSMTVSTLMVAATLVAVSMTSLVSAGGKKGHGTGKKHKGHKFAHNPHYKKGSPHHGHSWKGKTWEGTTHKHFVYRGNWNGWSHSAFYKPLQETIYWSPEDSVWYRKDTTNVKLGAVLGAESGKSVAEPEAQPSKAVYIPVAGMTDELLDDGDEATTSKK